ncbi:hypothetical protein HanPI659440_Chr13g0481121 [Helianthus annuus]|nr:hypothetical protein HanPI659440_Chr13g0481121 [Helianthus annuus]
MVSCPWNFGTWPIKLLDDRDNTCNDLNFPKDSGIGPISLLSDRSMTLKLVNLPRASGTKQLNLFPSKRKSSNALLEHFDTLVDGLIISPSRSLFETINSLR